MTVPTRVLLVEPCDVFRRAISEVIRGSGHGFALAAEAGYGVDPIAVARAIRPDVILLCLLERDGLETIRPLTDAAHGARIVMFASHDDPETVVAAIRSGASGFIPKWSSAEDVLAALSRAADGELAIHPALTLNGLLWAAQNPEPSETTPTFGDAGLTPREREILVMLTDGASPSMIAARLVLSRRTVEGHLLRIYRKLGVNGQIGAIRAFMQTQDAS